MKKLILLLTALFLVTALNAQIAFTKNEDYKEYTGVATDTLSATYLLKKNIYVGSKDFVYDYYIQVEADSLGDGTDITCRLRGSMDGLTYTNIGDAITWGVTESDTTFAYSSLTRTVSISQAHTGTATVASYIMTADTTGLATYFADTVTVAPQITTFADTYTTTETYTGGVSWRYLEVYFLGSSGANMELEKLRIRILKVQ